MSPDRLIYQLLQSEPISFNLSFKKVLDQNRTGLYEQTTKGYRLYNLNATYSVPSSKDYKIIFQIDNIFNVEYYNHLSRIKSIMPEKGRNIPLNRLFF